MGGTKKRKKPKSWFLAAIGIQKTQEEPIDEDPYPAVITSEAIAHAQESNSAIHINNHRVSGIFKNSSAVFSISKAAPSAQQTYLTQCVAEIAEHILIPEF